MKTIFRAGLVSALLLMALTVVRAAEPTSAQKIKSALVFTSPIVHLGTNEPAEADSTALLAAIAKFQANGIRAGFAALEEFVNENPQSPWTPSLRSHLAERYFSSGNYSDAKAQWMAIQKSLKGDTTPEAQAMSRAANKSIASIQREPGNGLLSCGTLSLSQAIKVLSPGDPAAHDVTHAIIPENGFSLAELAAISTSNGFPAIAAKRMGEARLTTPAIVHYKLGHFLALLGADGRRVRVYDPLSGGIRWLERDSFEAEISGNFLLFATNLPTGWVSLSKQEADQARGQVCNNPSPNIDDDEDGPDDDDGPPCPPPPPPDSGDGPGAGEGDPCPPEDGDAEEAGMPTWRVSEPYISLWLHDTPLFYRQSSGRPFKLRLSYSQRAGDKGATVPGFGPKWECDWFGFLEQKQAAENDPVVWIDNFKAGGGRTRFLTDGSKEFKSGRSLSIAGSGGGGYTGGAYSMAIWSPRARQNLYGFPLSYVSGVKRYFLTNRVDAYRRLVHFGYVSNNISGNTVYRLTQVTDMDGKQCTLAYTNTGFPNRVTSVTDPYSRNAFFIYDNLGRLTNITDMAGMNSSFKYDLEGNITNLITPYGTNIFRHLASSNGLGDWNRALEITEPEGKQQLYMYRSQSTTDMTGAGLPASYTTLRNSFHWNRAQYNTLSAAAKADLFNMDGTNYLNASIKNWYVLDRFNESGSYVSDTMNAQAGPAVDGETRVNGVKYIYYGQVDLEFSQTFYGIGLQGTLKKVTDMQWVSGDRIEIPRNSWGRPTEFIYHRNGTVGVYTNEFDTDGRILKQVWGPRGERLRGYGYHATITNLLTSVTNALGEVQRYTHDSGMRVTSVTHPSGLVTTNTYYPSGTYAGFLQTSIDIGFRTNSYSYLNGNVLTHTNELGLVTSNLCDNLNRLVCTFFPDGTTISNRYDTTRKLDLIARKDRLNQWTYFGYNRLRQLTAETNVNNQVTLYDYCDCGSPSQTVRLNGSSPVITTFAYDIAGRRTNATYADGYFMNYGYDNGWPNGSSSARIQDASGLVVHMQNTDYGQLANFGLSQDPNGSPDGYLMQRTFDEYGRLATMTDRNGVTITNAYDVLGRLTNRATLDIYGSVSSTVSNAYTARGLTNSSDELGHKTWFVRDAAGRLLFQTNANNEVLQFTYNPADEMLTLTDGKNQTTTWNYDEYGRVTNKLDAVREILRYKYDPQNRLTNRWTAAKGETSYGYDAIGNLTNVDYPGTVMDITLKYDWLNLLTNVVDAIGTTKFAYTDGGQVLNEDGPWAEDTVSYAYNARRRSGLSLAQPNASAWTQSYGYDQYNRLSNAVSAAGNFIYTFWSGGSYSLSDRVQCLGLGGLNYYYEHNYIENQYDELARLSSTTLYENYYTVLNQHSYDYNDANQHTKQTFTGGNYLDYTYDDIGQLKTAKGWENDTTTIRLQEQFGYAYDKAWNLNYRTNNALVQTFGVNNLNELTNAARTGTLTVAGLASQPGANLTGVTVSGNGLTTGSADVYADGSWAKANATLANGNNTYTATATDTYSRTATDSVTVNLATNVTFQYDWNGNLTNDGRRVFEYDYENQLTNVYVASAWRSEYKYDAFGRRRIRKEYGWSGSVWTLTNEVRYVYDGMLSIQERDANNFALVSYTRGNDLSGSLQDAGGIGGLLARTDHAALNAQLSTAHAYYHADGNGNITALVNTNGAVVARYNYDPYGNLLGMSGPLAEANTYRFSSKEYNGNAALYYYGFRFYEPNLQRWLNRDPLGDIAGLAYTTVPLLYEIEAGPAGGMNTAEFLDIWTQINRNLYGALGNNPPNIVDPQGLFLANVISGIVGGGVDLALQLTLNGGRWDCVSWTSVGISAVASGAGYGLAATASKIGKLARAGRVLEKAAKKTGPLSNYMKGEVAAAQASRKAAAGAAAGFAAAQAAKQAAKAAEKESLDDSPPSDPGPSGEPQNDEKPPCP